jgi:hypothetical protein
MSSRKTVLLANDWPAWKVANGLGDPNKAHDLIRFLRERHTEKFFEPIGSLRAEAESKWGYGFAIMALCSLLVETIQSYWEGWPSTNKSELKKLENRKPPAEYAIKRSEWPDTRKAFEDFFSNPVFEPHFPSVDGGEFYDCIRNGLLHQGQTKGGWKIWTLGPLWDSDRLTVNRNEFVDAVEHAFDAYLKVLEKEAWNSPRWAKARRKIWWLIELS